MKKCSRRDLLKAVSVGGLFSSVIPARSGAEVSGETDLPGRFSKNPYSQATAVWHMATLEAVGGDLLTLQANGAKTVGVGQRLEGAEYTESLKRGGDGFVAIFDNPAPENFLGTSKSNDRGWLSMDAGRATGLRPKGSSSSLYVRAFFDKPEGWGTLLFSDWLGLAVHESGLAVAFVGQKTPGGVTFRELPLATVERGLWLDLIIRIGHRRLEFFCNGMLRNSIPLGKGLGVPFDSELSIGAFSGLPDNPGKRSLCLSRTKIDTIALWDRSLDDAQVAFLSGSIEVRRQVKRNPADQAIAAYNRLHDASENKDLELCRSLERSMREIMRQDPTRPVYHLTAPVGWIFDPCGAFQFQGRYHVSSYRNIYALLRFNGLDHYVSDDLVHWRIWPTGPIADTEADVGGIWLSNHIIDDQGLPNVIYCAWGSDGKERGIRARSHDGMISYTDKKVVFPDYHDGHVWKDGDTWYAITMRNVGGKRPEDPEIVIFSSTDLDRWTERGVLFRPRDYWGQKMAGMEFPYFFFLGEKAVLMSGCMPAGVFYWIGRFDRKSFKFIPDDPEGLRVDYANPFHCFNPSTVDAKGPNGVPRRIVMAMESLSKGSVQGLPWNGVHALPRVLTLDGNHLRQDPLPELEVLRGKGHSFKNIEIAPDTSGYIKIRGDALEIRAEFENRGASSFGMKVRLSKDGKTFVRVFYDAKTNEYGVDGNLAKPVFSISDPRLGRGPTYLPSGKPVQLIIFLDKTLIETFANGQTCTTCIEDTNPLHDGLDLFSEGGAAMCTRLDIWEMKSSGEALN